MHISATVVTVLAGVLTVAAASPAAAQDKVAAPLIDAIARCLDIREDAARLACSDLAGRAIVDASRRREIVVVDKEEVKTTRRSLFGFSLPRIGLFGKGGPDSGEEVDRIESKIVGVASLGYGKYGIDITDGARWSTTEAWPSGGRPEVGAAITIKKGALGNYFIRSGGNGVRAMRTK